MNKTQLIKALAQRTGATQASVRAVIDALFDADDGVLSNELATRAGVTVSGFGSFVVADRRARLGRNPRTGEPVQVPPTTVPVFRPAPALKKRIADS